jgi:hypothetical protein
MADKSWAGEEEQKPFYAEVRIKERWNRAKEKRKMANIGTSASMGRKEIMGKRVSMIITSSIIAARPRYPPMRYRYFGELGVEAGRSVRQLKTKTTRLANVIPEKISGSTTAWYFWTLPWGG